MHKEVTSTSLTDTCNMKLDLAIVTSYTIYALLEQRGHFSTNHYKFNIIILVI